MIVKIEINIKEMCCFGFHCSKVNFSLKEMKISGDWLTLTLESRAHLPRNASPVKAATRSLGRESPHIPFFFLS